MRAARYMRSLLALVALGGPCLAGDWHSGASLGCTDCHTMHNSAAGLPMRYDGSPDPAPKLLRHATSIALCTHCHDGSTPAAPDVWTPVLDHASQLPGGYLPTEAARQAGQASGHVVGGDATTPPGGTEAIALTCVSCHDPHGGPSYRNLRLDPAGQGASLPVTAHQTVKADGTNAGQVYRSANVVHKAGFSSWCQGCHGTTGDPSSHSVDRTISGAPLASYTRWAQPVSNRVPVQSPTDNVIPSPDDQVTCLSCHKAHGNANPFTQIWADDTSATSTCEQCHE